ncbi:hypothetical protein SMC26_34110 [Actinomadura fulvescens]|uniref:Secreted protein n=1 Tax=Actinomadura fulvescens TaxID=46160 RepID=A0ABN3PPG5_9ACTN
MRRKAVLAGLVPVALATVLSAPAQAADTAEAQRISCKITTPKNSQIYFSGKQVYAQVGIACSRKTTIRTSIVLERNGFFAALRTRTCKKTKYCYTYLSYKNSKGKQTWKATAGDTGVKKRTVTKRG